jgi:hypothetical protein
MCILNSHSKLVSRINAREFKVFPRGLTKLGINSQQKGIKAVVNLMNRKQGIKKHHMLLNRLL